MKKIISLILICFMLLGCQPKKSEDINKDKYLNLIDTLNNHDPSLFVSSTNLFDINYEITKTGDEYRYFVSVDNPKNAMYGVEIVVAEKGVNYSLNMAPNAGIFEEKEYNMLPGQAVVDKGYVGGINVSGITSNETPTLHVLVQWYSKKQDVHQEFLVFNFEDAD